MIHRFRFSTSGNPTKHMPIGYLSLWVQSRSVTSGDLSWPWNHWCNVKGHIQSCLDTNLINYPLSSRSHHVKLRLLTISLKSCRRLFLLWCYNFVTWPDLMRETQWNPSHVSNSSESKVNGKKRLVTSGDLRCHRWKFTAICHCEFNRGQWPQVTLVDLEIIWCNVKGHIQSCIDTNLINYPLSSRSHHVKLRLREGRGGEGRGREGRGGRGRGRGRGEGEGESKNSNFRLK